MRKLSLLLLACLLWLGCSGTEDPVSTEVLVPVPDVQQDRLEGTWGGYFPGSSPENPVAGLEIQFERPRRQGFLHRAPRDLDRSDVSVQQNGDNVTVTFAGQGRFVGAFEDGQTIRGRFLDEARGGEFPMRLVSAASLDRPRLTRAEELQPQVAGPFLTLEVSAVAAGQTYQLLYGLGTILGPGNWESLQGSLDGETAGDSLVSRLYFFPDTLTFDFYPSGDEVEIASLEFNVDDFASLSTAEPVSSPQGKGSYLYDESNQEQEVTSVSMVFVSTPGFLDFAPWATSFANPDSQTVTISGQSYTIPNNSYQLLESLGGYF